MRHIFSHEKSVNSPGASDLTLRSHHPLPKSCVRSFSFSSFGFYCFKTCISPLSKHFHILLNEDTPLEIITGNDVYFVSSVLMFDTSANYILGCDCKK